MAQKILRAVHYVNQFFGQIGGEAEASVGFSVKAGPVGPGNLLQKKLEGRVEIVATVICGDNYFASNLQEASEKLLELVKEHDPDIFFAGPAFHAGRYGISCGQACKTIGESLKIPVITGMYEENPGVEVYRPHAYIARTGNNAAKMSEALDGMVRIGLHVVDNTHGKQFVSGVGIGTPEEEGYFPQMMIRNVFTEKSTAERAVDMVLARIKGEPFETEMPYAVFEKITPAPPIKDIKKARIAIVSDGGLVDKDNKGHIKTRGCNVWTSYNLDEFFSPDKKADDYYVSHTGYYGVEVIADRNRMVPYDILTELESSGEIETLHKTYYVTCGNSTVAKWCARMGNEIVAELQRDKVDGVILTST